jgi:hypothetical protein
MCGVHLWEGGGGAGRIFAHLTKLEPSLRFSDSFLALYSHRFIVFVEPLSLANLNKSLLHTPQFALLRLRDKLPPDDEQGLLHFD